MKLPNNLPPLKKAPKGYEWTYRGTNWNSGQNSLTEIAFVDPSVKGNDWMYYEKGGSCGFEEYHYVELTPIIRPSLEEQINLAKSMVGKTFLYKHEGKVTIEHWAISNEFSHLNHGIMVNDEINDFGVSIYVIDEYESQYPVLCGHLSEHINCIEVKLNETYNAKIYMDKIQVGCQTFPITILDELLKAHNKL